MVRIGIDYSLTSPALCIEKNNKLHFISLFDTHGNNYKKSIRYRYYNEIGNIVEVIPYVTCINKMSYISEQQCKIYSAHLITSLIMSVIDKYVGDDTCYIAIEGFSYGSMSNSVVDLIMYQSFLRCDLMNKYGAENIFVVSPSEVKKRLCGKGNANKEDMINAFISNTLNDSMLENNELYMYLIENELDFKHIKPIDDICDSYAVLRCMDKKEN